MATQQWKAGSILQIPFDKKRAAFAQVLEFPEIAVFDVVKANSQSDVAPDVGAAPVLFRLWVMKVAVTSGRWRRIGKAAIRSELTVAVPRFKQDPLTHQFSIYLNGKDEPATADQCVNLEPAAVWSAEHVEARLRDHVAGRPHQPLEVLREGLPRRTEIR